MAAEPEDDSSEEVSEEQKKLLVEKMLEVSHHVLHVILTSWMKYPKIEASILVISKNPYSINTATKTVSFYSREKWTYGPT